MPTKGAGETVQCLRALAVPVEDQNLVPAPSAGRAQLPVILDGLMPSDFCADTQI